VAVDWSAIILVALWPTLCASQEGGPTAVKVVCCSRCRGERALTLGDGSPRSWPPWWPTLSSGSWYAALGPRRP